VESNQVSAIQEPVASFLTGKARRLNSFRQGAEQKHAANATDGRPE